jgi:hypothetical protein
MGAAWEMRWARLDDQCGAAASLRGSPSFGRRRAGREGSAPAAVAVRPGGSRRAADASPSAEPQSVGPSRARDRFRSTKASFVAPQASPPLCVLSRYLDGQEARNVCAPREPFDRHSLSRGRPPHCRFRKKTKAGPVAGRACHWTAFAPARLSRSDRQHHRAPVGTAASCTPLLSQLLCRSARIWLRAELSLCMGPTRTGGLSVKAIPVQEAEDRSNAKQWACFQIEGGQPTR